MLAASSLQSLSGGERCCLSDRVVRNADDQDGQEHHAAGRMLLVLFLSCLQETSREGLFDTGTCLAAAAVLLAVA